MSNIINVKEDRNILSFKGEVFDLVANSSNFYLKFELDEEWDQNKIITVIFNFDGRYTYVELDENRMCQIPPTKSSRIWFCITTEPDETSKLSSTLLSLDVLESGDTDTSEVEEYKYAHKNLMGIVQSLLDGKFEIKEAEFAKVSARSETQVSLTGDEIISGEKNFIGELKQKENKVLDCSHVGAPNILYNGNFLINERGSSTYTRAGEDIYTADRWGMFYGNGSFNVSTHELTGLDEEQPVVFAQWIESTKEILYGERVTISATINEIRHSSTFDVPTTYQEDFIFNIFEGEGFCFRVLVRSNNLMSVQFVVENGVTIKIDKVKLELSEFETRYVERPRAEELLMCQRYFQKLSVNTMGYAFNETTLFFLVNLTTTMRSYKSVVIKTKPNVVINGEKVACEEISLRQVIDNGILFKYTGSGFVKNNPYLFILGVIHVDGDIYL